MKPVSVALQDTIRQFQSIPGLSAPGNVTKLTDDGVFQGQIVWSKFTWPAVLGGEEVYIWGELFGSSRLQFYQKPSVTFLFT